MDRKTRSLRQVAAKLYLSRFGVIAHWLMVAAKPLRPNAMTYGYRDRVSGKFRLRTRITNSAKIADKRGISMSDGVWIGHCCTIDGSNGVTLGEGVQLGDGARVLSHGSHHSIRLLGQSYIDIPISERIGYQRAPVSIGDYTFIGANSVILPGTTLGKGCLVAAGAVVSGDFPDFSFIRGAPGVAVGDTREIDVRHPLDHHFAPERVAEWADQH